MADDHRTQGSPRPAAGGARGGARKGRGNRIDATVGSTRARDRSRLSGSIRAGVRRRLWLRSTWPDFLLVLVVACSLVFTISYGFHSAWAYRGNAALIAGLQAPLLLALYAGTWSKRAVLPSAIATAALGLAYVGVATALSPDPALFAPDAAGDMAVNDAEGNYAVFALLLVAVTVAVFLLSRRVVGLVFLLACGIVACGAVQYLWREWASEQPGIPVFLAAFAGIVMLFVYQTYKQSVYSANRAKRTAFSSAFGFAALVALACVLVGAGVFYGVVEAAAPDTAVWKPFESYVSPPTDDEAWDYTRIKDEGSETSDDTGEGLDKVDGEAEGGDASGTGGLGVFRDTFIAQAAQALAGYDPDDSEQDFQSIEYLIVQWELVIAVVLLLAIVLVAVLLQRARRSWRLRRIAGRSGAYQVWYLYEFMMGRLRRLKLRKPAALTTLEFAVGFSKPMVPFTRGTGGVDFVDVSSVYQDAVYGGIEPSAEDLASVKAYYRAFFKNARSYVGWPRWLLWKFWRI